MEHESRRAHSGKNSHEINGVKNFFRNCTIPMRIFHIVNPIKIFIGLEKIVNLTNDWESVRIFKKFCGIRNANRVL